jgi:2-methylcitrate dehydratase PrpD
LKTQCEAEPGAKASKPVVAPEISSEFWNGCATGKCGETGAVGALWYSRGKLGSVSVTAPSDVFPASYLDEVERENEDQNHSKSSVFKKKHTCQTENMTTHG